MAARVQRVLCLFPCLSVLLELAAAVELETEIDSDVVVGFAYAFWVTWVSCSPIHSPLPAMVPMSNHSHSQLLEHDGGVGGHTKHRCSEPNSDGSHHTDWLFPSPFACKNGISKDLACTPSRVASASRGRGLESDVAPKSEKLLEAVKRRDEQILFGAKTTLFEPELVLSSSAVSGLE